MNDFSEVSQAWLDNFVDAHYPVVDITQEEDGAYLNIEEVLYNYILGMEDDEVEKYFH
jgi:expansin (peptidoglycan-binding protein)